MVHSVDEYFQLPGLEDGNFPVTVEVRNQLAALLRETPGPQINALFRAIMTTVMNLEVDLLELKTEVVTLRGNSMDIYSRLLDLETRLRRSGVSLAYPAYPEPIEFFPE